MNPWQALLGDVPVPGDYWAEPVKRNGTDLNAPKQPPKRRADTDSRKYALRKKRK